MSEFARASADSILDPLGAELVPAVAPAGQLVVDVAGHRLCDAAHGTTDDDGGGRISPATLFDLASVTKIFTALTWMRLVEDRAVDLDAPVIRILPGFAIGSPIAAAVTWRQLLSHTSGLPAGLDLASTVDPAEARERVQSVRPIADPGTSVLYSDIGFMILGFGVEAITTVALDEAMRALVSEPAGLTVTFRPDRAASVAPTEFIASRGGRLRGTVHDENAAALGGIAGHAGLFGTAHDLARLGSILLAGGAPIVRADSLTEMTRAQAVDGALRRGLGFSLWSPDPEAASHPLGRRSYGHTGFTGTSVWMDPDRRLVVVLLTNAVYRGRAFNAFFAARNQAHSDIVAAVDRMAATRVEGIR